MELVNLGSVWRLVKAVAALGGEAPLERLEGIYGGGVEYLLGIAVELGMLDKGVRDVKGRRRVVYRLTGRALAALGPAERCPVEVEVRGGLLVLKTPFGFYRAEYSASALLSIAEKLAPACGEDRRRLYKRLRESAERAVERARGLERWLVAARPR
ncbi:MAG: hypothetical protein ACP5KY_08465 [Thermoproteus sp.]